MRFIALVGGMAAVTPLLFSPPGPAQEVRGPIMPSMPVNAPRIVETSDPNRDYDLGMQALKDQQYTVARKAFQRMLRVIDEDPAIYVLTGLAYTGEGNQSLARRYYEAAIRVDPTFVVAYKQLGILYAERGERDKALKQLAELNRLADRCRAPCADADDIKSAIRAVNAALGT